MGEESYEIELDIEPLVVSSSLLTDKSLPERRGYQLLDAVDPNDGRLWDVRLSHEFMDRVARRGRGPALEVVHCLPDVLEHPTIVFQGIREDGEDGWLCYCGKPQYRYVGREGHQRVAFLDEVYVAFVNGDRVVYSCRWDKAAAPHYRWPEESPDRFRRRVR